MDEDVRPVGVELTARNDQYDAAMRQSAQETRALELSLDSVTAKLSSLSKSAGKKLMLIGAADVALLTGAAAAAGNLESQMSGLDAQAQATQRTMGQGKRVYSEYAGAVSELRKEFPMTTSSAAELVGVIAKLGDSSRPIDEVARSFTKLSGATGEGPAQLAAGVLTLSRQMGNGTRDINEYNNTILRLSSTTGQGAGALVSFASTLAPAGRQLRMSQTDILGVSTAFARAGQDGNLAANAFNKMANDISVAIQTNSPELKTYADLIGMTTDQLKSSNKTDVITQVFESLNKQGPDAIRTLQRLGFEGQRNLRAIQGVSQMQGGIGGAVKDARLGFDEKDAGTLNRASEAAFNGLSDQARKLTESSKKNAEAFGAPFAAATTGVLKGITSVSNATGSLIDGPLGKIGQIATAAAGPLAILSGLLLTIAGRLATLAAIRFVGAGAGTLGLLNGMGRGGAATRATAASMAAGRGNWLQNAMWAGGNRVGGAIRNARGETFTQRAGASRASWAAGLPLRGAAAGLGLIQQTYSPLAGGFNDATKRNRFIKSDTFTGMAPIAAGRRLWQTASQRADETMAGATRMAGFVSGPAGPKGEFLGSHFARSAAGSGSLGAEATRATAGLKGVGEASAMLRNRFTSFMGTLAGSAVNTGRMAAPLAGQAARGIGGAIAGNPLMMGILALTAGSALYGKHKDKDTAADYKDYESYMARYADSAGTSVASRSYTMTDQYQDRSEANAAKSMSDAVSVTGTDASLARSSQRKTVDKRITKDMSADQIVQLLAPDLASMDAIPPEMIQNLKYDLLDTRSAGDTSKILKQLVDPSAKGRLANVAGSVDYDPAAFFEGVSGKTEGRTALNNMLASIEARASSAAMGSSDPDAAYGATMRSGFMKGLDEGVFKKGTGPGGKIGGGLWGDAGSLWDNKGGTGVGGGQEAFKNFFEKTYGAKLDMGAGFTKDIKTGGAGPGSGAKSSEDFLRQALMSRDSYLGSFLTDMGISRELDPTGLKGDDRKKRVNEIMKMFSSDFMMVGGKATANDEMYDKVAGSMGGGSLASALVGAKDTGIRSDAAQKSLDNVGNAARQYEAVIEQVDQMADKGDDLVTIQEKMRQAAAQLGDSDSGDFARAAQQYAEGRQAQKMSMADPFTQADYQISQLNTLKRTPAADRDDDWTAAMNTAQAGVDSVETSMDSMLKSLVTQSREFAIQQQQSIENFGISRARSEADFARQRERSEEDFNRSRKRSQDDYDLQLRQSRSDFNLSRLRQEEDFNHQVEVMAEQSAKSLYNIYDRVAVQRTQSAQNVLINGADQVRRMQEQAANLDKLRSAGLTDNSIQQLGLGDAANAQQAGRLVAEIGDSPEIVQKLNAQVKARLKAAKELVTDDSSTEWEEMNRSYKLGRERGQDDFEKQLNRSNKAFKLSLQRQDDDFARSMSRQAEDFGRSMRQMAEDFDRSQSQAKAAMDRSLEDMTKNGEELLKESGETLDGAAVMVKDKILTALQAIRDESNPIFGGIKKDFEDIFGTDVGGAIGNQMGKKQKKKTWFERNTPMDDGGGGAGGMGGDTHSHSAGCGHGGSTLPAVLNGSGGPTGAGDGAKAGASDGPRWQKPINAGLSSPYGMRRHPITGVVKLHDGNDYGAPMGTPYGAAGDGVVRTTARTAWGGNVPYIDHGNGVQTFYGHSSSISVSPGQKVRKGQIVGKVGSVGYSTGPHLHFGALKDGRPFDSRSLIGGAGAGKLFGSGKSVPGMAGFDEKGSIELQKRYPKVEAAGQSLPRALAPSEGSISDRINAGAERLAKAHNIDVSYGGPVDTWFGNGAIFDRATAIGGGNGAGERGSELLLPLNNQGADFLHTLLNKMTVGLGSNAVGSQQVVNHNYHQTKIDKSTTFTGAITVQAADPREFLSALQAQQRQAALINPTLAGARG